MRQLSLLSFLNCPVPTLENPMLVNVRGCNGSGKSTIPMMMLQTDPESFEVIWKYDGKERVVATVFPKYQFLAIGRYRTKCGGLDSLKSTQEIKDAVDVLWDCNFHILMEGVLASTVRGTYINLFQSMVYQHPITRQVTIFNIAPSLETCLERIQQRNGGKPIKSELVEDKRTVVLRNHQYFLDAGFRSIVVSNEQIDKSETLEWFYSKLQNKSDEIEPTLPIPTKNKQQTSTKILGSDGKPLSKHQKMKTLPKFDGSPEPLYIPKPVDLDGYEWAQYYKEPDPAQVKINWTNMRLYWYWIAERMNIWYKRTVLREPQPWTSDIILQENKFTNVFRDLDRGTVVYIKEILSKLDEPCDDMYTRVKEVVLNTQIYRLFLKYDTWKQIGFIYLDTFGEQWTRAKENLRRMKANGETIWHAAYFINDLKSANPNSNTNADKLENAICLCELFYQHLDDTTQFVMDHNMKECLEHLNHFPAIGDFTVYEWLCDWGMAYKHVQNYFVDWTDDSYVNIGPGNKMGLDFIFEDKGNLDYFELNFYLRASWRHYLQRYGYYNQFISQLPEWARQDINMRVIEHDACEVQKYLNVYYGTGKCKVKFKNESQDNLDYLLI